MQLPIANIPAQMMIRLSEAVHNARQAGTYLSAYRQDPPLPNLWLLCAGGVFICLIVIADSWSGSELYIIAGTLLAYLIARQFQKWLAWRKLGKDAVFFDPLYFISISGDKLSALPLSHYKDSDIILSMSGYLARFNFQGTTVISSCSSSNDEGTLRFQNLLSQYCTTMRQSIDNQEPVQNISQTFREKVSCRRTPLIIASFALLLLWFVVPAIVDHNQYLIAKKKNSATAYRIYLHDTRNIRYRKDARDDIKKIYNSYIERYRDKALNSTGADALIKVFEYLRERDLYNMCMVFFPRSELIDLSSSSEYHIIPVTPSFSDEKNFARQQQVIDAVKNSIGQLFPTDIVALTTKESGELPKLEVYYTYRNNPESIYYPVKEKDLPERRRTWYYGIKIDWWFRISLPTQSEPIYEFNLVSQPAQTFSSESFSADAVYSNMAISAFTDFQSAFYKQFLNWQ